MSVMQNTHRYKIIKNSPDLWIKGFPWKEISGHKYSRGKVVVYGGKKELVGATILSSLAALRTGTGSVKIICSKKTLHTYSVKFPSALKVEINSIQELKKFLKKEKITSILIGPGAGSNKKIKKIVIITSVGISILGFFVLPKLIPIFFPKFIDTVDAIGIMSLAVVPEAITMLYMSKMLGREKSKFILIAKLVSLITIIVGFIILGPIFGIIGLAGVIVVASVLQSGILAFSNKFLEGEKNEK